MRYTLFSLALFKMIMAKRVSPYEYNITFILRKLSDPEKCLSINANGCDLTTCGNSTNFPRLQMLNKVDDNSYNITQINTNYTQIVNAVASNNEANEAIVNCTNGIDATLKNETFLGYYFQ
jgi:hypothetical protein